MMYRVIKKKDENNVAMWRIMMRMMMRTPALLFISVKKPGDVRMRYVRGNVLRGVPYREFMDNMEARMAASINSQL